MGMESKIDSEIALKYLMRLHYCKFHKLYNYPFAIKKGYKRANSKEEMDFYAKNKLLKNYS
jgi:hypothetical protein